MTSDREPHEPGPAIPARYADDPELVDEFAAGYASIDRGQAAKLDGVRLWRIEESLVGHSPHVEGQRAALDGLYSREEVAHARERARREEFADLAKAYGDDMTTDQVDQFRYDFIRSFMDEHVTETGAYPGWVLCEALDRIELGLPDGRTWEQYSCGADGFDEWCPARAPLNSPDNPRLGP